MSKVTFFSTRDDERPFLLKENEKYQFDVNYVKEPLTIDNVDLTKDQTVISVSSAYPLSDAMLDILKANGVTYIATRATGHNHVKTDSAKERDIHLGYVPGYSPNSISEYTVGLALAVVRNLKYNIEKVENHDFTYGHLMGRELRQMVIGVIGDGNIGFEVIKSFYGMGCKVVAYARHEKEHVKAYAEYVDFETLLRESDLITLHCPLSDETKHMLNAEAFAKMKDGVYIINTARGGLIDHEALIDNLDKGKVTGAGLDVYEYESNFNRKNLENEPIEDEIFLNLIHRSNVIYAPHIAFLTDNAVSTIVRITFSNIDEYFKQGHSRNDLW